MSETTLLKLIEDIIVDLKRIQSLPKPYRDEDDDFSLPRLIGVGDGRAISISKNIDETISRIARIKVSDNELLRRHFSTHYFNSLVRRSFGPTLIKIDLDSDVRINAKLVLKDITSAIEKEVGWVLSDRREYAYGCDLFLYKDVEPFDIGPVRVEPREVWLNRKASDGLWVRLGPDGRVDRFDYKIADGPISAVAKRRIARTWQGHKLKKRKPSVDSSHERDVIAAIGSSPYVCSVKTAGLDGKAGQDKALLAARLVLAVIALMWEFPSRALTGIKLSPDRGVGYQALLSFTPEGLILQSGTGKKLPHAPWIERDLLDENLREYKDIFEIVGEAIHSFVHPVDDPARPKVSSMLLHSLIWFHEGCRENIAQIAIVKFVSVLEVLSGGGSKESIKKLVCTCLGVEENVKIHRDGLTVANMVDLIYTRGRNRMIHGDNKALDHDWSEARDLAELLARLCFIFCAEWAINNPQSDDPKGILALSKFK